MHGPRPVHAFRALKRYLASQTTVPAGKIGFQRHRPAGTEKRAGPAGCLRAGPSPRRGAAGRGQLAELAGDVAVVAVAEAEPDVVADVDPVRAGAAVDQAGFLERGLGAGPAGLCPQHGVGVALPGGERGEQDAGLALVEVGGAGGIAQDAALRASE